MRRTRQLVKSNALLWKPLKIRLSRWLLGHLSDAARGEHSDAPRDRRARQPGTMNRRRDGAIILVGLLSCVLGGQEAVAGPATEVASAFSEGDTFDLHTSLHYRYTTRSSVIKRESAGLPGTGADDQMPVVRDLLFSGSTHELIPRIELGIFHDFWVYAELPIVLHQTSELSFDQRDTPCDFSGGGAPTCINAGNSSTVRDRLLPETGFDSFDPSGPGFTGGSTIFRGPNRRGTTQLHLGLGVAPMNQERDDTKPTWKIGGEIRLPIGATKTFNRSEPERNKGVSEGVTEIRLWTSMARKIRWAEPHFELWWQAPLSVKGSAPLAPLDQPFGVTSESPQQRAGTTFGVEATLWEKPEDDLRVGLDLSADLNAIFEGRGYSDMWQVFAYAGSASAADAPLVLDEEPTISGVQAKSHPGASNIENFMTLNTQLQVTADVGEKIRFAAGMGIGLEQSHLISFADAGKDAPTCTASVTSGCETASNQVVDANTFEVNPLHASTIDQAGHRYRVAEGRTFHLSLSARILF